MAKRALLIGCPYGDLAGPVPDVERLAKLLEPRGFGIQRCIEQDATREGILRAYRSMIDRTASGDAVVIYYSGHGAHSLDEAYKPRDDRSPARRFHHFIVPMDLGESTGSDFRGILSLELSSLLAQLTAKTTNVTVIFDCCHSGGMTRDVRLRLRALPKEWFAGAFDHMERLTRGEVPGFPLDGIAVEGNPYAVRLMAATPSQQAWEYEGAEGAYGLMTNALLRSFNESEGRPVTWDAIKRRVRELVQQLEPGQYTDVEGPSSRFVFELEEADLTGIVPIEVVDSKPRLQGGKLLGIAIGDVFVIMPSGFQKVDRTKALARATVTQVGGAWSSVSLEPSSDALAMPAGAQAFPASRTYQRRLVMVKAGEKFRSNIEEAVAKSGFLRLFSDDETVGPAEILARVEERDGRLHITGQDDRDLISPLRLTDGVGSSVTENLERLARARQLETLESGMGIAQLTAKYELDWGRVVAGRPVTLPPSGAVIFVGDRVFVRVRNPSDSKLYVSIFDVGLAGQIKLLTRNWSPSGIELEPGGTFTFGYQDGEGWRGIGPISWPTEVPKDGQPRPESLIVVISNRPQDLRAYESAGMAAPKGAEPNRSELERLADQVATGRTRDLEVDSPLPDVRYAVEHISLFVDPTDAAIHIGVTPTAERGLAKSLVGEEHAGTSERVPVAAVTDVASFLIDERPQPSAAYRRPRSIAPPTAIAVQLGEVIVHSNRALFSADVRVDALVITGSKEPEGVYRAGTAKFERIKDGDRLPLDNLLLYHWPANGFLDLAVWVSRDDKHSLSLADMLKAQLTGAEFKEAALLLAGLAVATPTAGTIVVALGAATVVSNIAYKLLSGAAGKSIGLYRTSLLANERFAAGRHPASGSMRAQDFSFWYQVSEVK